MDKLGWSKMRGGCTVLLLFSMTGIAPAQTFTTLASLNQATALAATQCRPSGRIPDALLTCRAWITFAPPRPFNPNSGTFPSEDELRTSLQAMVAEGWRGIVTYSLDGTLAEIPRIAKEVGFDYVVAGLFWNDSGQLAVEKAKALAAVSYVDAYVLGNEGLNSRYTRADLELEIAALKSATQRPVATSESIDRYEADATLAMLGDWVFANIQPYIGGIRSIPDAVQDSVIKFAMLRQQAPSRVVVAKELWWPTCGSSAATEANQTEFFRQLSLTPIKFVWGEYADQFWKTAEGPQGPCWGLHTDLGQPKQMIQALQQVYTATYENAAPSTTVDLNQHGLTGSWYEPATSGQGIEVEVFPNPSSGTGSAFVSWFTYDTVSGGAGRQRWYTAEGHVVTGQPSASLTIYQNIGGNFNAPPVTAAQAVGTATLSMDTCTSGQLAYNFTDGTGRAGTIPLSRLTQNVTCSTTTPYPTNADFALSGNWYAPATSGQGFTVEVNPNSSVVFSAWYTYTPNGTAAGAAGQRWYTAEGTFTPGARSIPVTIYETTGGIFDTPTPPGQKTVAVGSGTIAFQSCSAATFNYNFTGGSSSGASGTIALSRVGPVPPGCAELPSDGSVACTNGTLMPGGTNPGFGSFARYQSDWHPQTAADLATWRILDGHEGGFGNTLEYLGCANDQSSVWLQFGYDALMQVAVRDGWLGATDRGLRIGDPLSTVQAHYPEAVWQPTRFSMQPDYDVWVVEPAHPMPDQPYAEFRIALKNGKVAMLHVTWYTPFMSAGDPLTVQNIIGPYDRINVSGPISSQYGWDWAVQPVVAVQAQPAELTMGVDQVATLWVYFFGEVACCSSQWTSSAPSIVRIDSVQGQYGVVHAVAPGEAVITIRQSPTSPHTAHVRVFATPLTATALSSGVPVAGLAGSEDSAQYYWITVPPGAAQLEVTTSGGTGSVLVHVSPGRLPLYGDIGDTSGTQCYEVASTSNGSFTETKCTLLQPVAGPWGILVYGYEAYQGVTLTAKVTP